MSALSLSTTSSTSPALTLSPTLFAHEIILPSFIVDESAGMLICSYDSGDNDEEEEEGAVAAAGGAAATELLAAGDGGLAA
jgi:hypothetical protein